MVVIFSVNGALATYSIEYRNAEHVIAKRSGNGEVRKDIPEEIEFFCRKGNWTSEISSEEVKNPIIKALNQSDQPEIT